MTEPAEKPAPTETASYKGGEDSDQLSAGAASL